MADGNPIQASDNISNHQQVKIETNCKEFYATVDGKYEAEFSAIYINVTLNGFKLDVSASINISVSIEGITFALDACALNVAFTSARGKVYSTEINMNNILLEIHGANVQNSTDYISAISNYAGSVSGGLYSYVTQTISANIADKVNTIRTAITGAETVINNNRSAISQITSDTSETNIESIQEFANIASSWSRIINTYNAAYNASFRTMTSETIGAISTIQSARSYTIT